MIATTRTPAKANSTRCECDTHGVVVRDVTLDALPPGVTQEMIEDDLRLAERDMAGEDVFDSAHDGLLDLDDPAEEAAERRLDVLNLMNELDGVRDQVEYASPRWAEADRRDAVRMVADLRWAVEKLRGVAERQTVEMVEAERRG